LIATKTFWNAKLQLVEANLVELDDQIFEVKKSLEELSADYQDAIIDETARHTVFENAKIAELVSGPPPPPFGTKFAPHPLSFAKQKLLKLEHTKYEKKIEKFKCHREMSQIDLSVRALEHLFVFRGSNKHDCLFSWLSWPRRRTPVLRRWNRNFKSRRRITIPSWLRSIRKSPSFASPRSDSV